MTDIFEQAHALGRAVTETEAYRALREARAAWEADAEAQRLEKENKAFLEGIRDRVSGGGATPEEMARMIRNGEALEARKTVRDFNAATEAFNDLREAVYQILALYLGPDTAGCAGCAGCAKGEQPAP